jgi:hypothetical protein
MRLEANLGVPANLSKIPATERRPLFVSHSTDDRPGQLFLAQVFGAVDSVWRPVYYSVEGPRAPHAGSILKHLETAGALVVLLSPELAERKHTQSWVAFEVGAAARMNLPILVIECPTGDTDFPVPGVTHFARRADRAVAIRETFWAKVARTDFRPVADEPLDAAGGNLLDRAGAFFYNLGLKTRSVARAFTGFICSEGHCRANYFVENGILTSTFKCPSCRQDTATPLVAIQEGLADLAEAAEKAQSSRPVRR